MEKSCRKCAPNARPRPLFYFGNQPKTAIACKKLFLKIRYFKRGLTKTLKKGHYIFSFNPVPFNGQNFQHQQGPRTSDQFLL